MGWLTNFLVELTGLVLADEMKAWAPRIVQWLIQRATRNLPDDQRERFDEEWRSHVYDTPGLIGKLVVASGFLRASRTMSLEFAQKASPWRQRRRYIGVAAAVSVVALVTVRDLKIAYEASTTRLEDLVDQKDHDMKAKGAEVEEWTRAHTIDLRSPTAGGKGQGRDACADCANFLNEGNVIALQNLNLSGMSAATVEPIKAFPIPTASAVSETPGIASPITSASALSGILAATAKPIKAFPIITSTALSETPFGNANPITGSALSGMSAANVELIRAFTTSASPGTPGGIALPSTAASALSESPFGNVNPILTASALSGTLVGAANPITSALTARNTP